MFHAIVLHTASSSSSAAASAAASSSAAAAAYYSLQKVTLQYTLLSKKNAVKVTGILVEVKVTKLCQGQGHKDQGHGALARHNIRHK